MNKNKLRAVMVENNDTCETLAEFLGISIGAFSRKLNERSNAGFTQPEIIKMKERYGLTAYQIDSIFFETQVS